MIEGYYVGEVWVDTAELAWDVARELARRRLVERVAVGAGHVDVVIFRERDGESRVMRAFWSTRGRPLTMTFVGA